MFTDDEKKRLLKEVADIHTILTGNGHPEEGLVHIARKNTEFRLFWEKFGWIIFGAIIGIPPSIVVLVMVAIIKNKFLLA